MSTAKGGRPRVPDHERRKHRVDVMINKREREQLDAAGDGRPRATLMREWALSVARGDAIPLAGALRAQVEAAAATKGITTQQWVSLACISMLEN